ncbi:MAG TPA: DUF202 domain-containing protein [Pyrinomonadaceae bacterium]
MSTPLLYTLAGFTLIALAVYNSFTSIDMVVLGAIGIVAGLFLIVCGQVRHHRRHHHRHRTRNAHRRIVT